MHIEAVKRRFSPVDTVPGYALEFLSDNGGVYIAAGTRALARALGLKQHARLQPARQGHG